MSRHETMMKMHKCLTCSTRVCQTNIVTVRSVQVKQTLPYQHEKEGSLTSKPDQKENGRLSLSGPENQYLAHSSKRFVHSVLLWHALLVPTFFQEKFRIRNAYPQHTHTRRV